VPDGPDETGNQVLRVHGFDRSDYEGRKWRPHFEIASEMGLMDSERSAKLSGSMFSVLVGDGAKLLRGLVRFALEINEPSYLEVMPPHLVRREVMVGSGQLPKFAGEAYQARDDDLWAIPTAEVPLMGLHQNEILEEAALPLAYMAHTNCWRREAGSAGKDTRGMQRLHEFQKVELVRICTPEATPSQLATLLADAERPLAELGLPYRVVALCSGDLGFSSTRTFDLEVYAPGLDRWLEVSSVSAVGDFQARRGRIRLRREASGQIDYVHSLNGSGLATPRVWAALIEHGYREDGTIAVPEALQPYVGKPFLEPACLPGRNLR
jgi:seryl-tRNA synthetase